MYSYKSLLESKTFWVALIQALAGGLLLFSETYPNVGWLVVAKSMLDVLVRLYTEKPVKLFQ